MDFPAAEYESRLQRAQKEMHIANLDALFLMSEPEIRWFTGFRTQFWQSPTRPWFLVVPANGKPVAVIPGIGGPLMQRTWIDDIRTWSAPDAKDDGITLLSGVLSDYSSIGMMKGHETNLRMPLADFEILRENLRTAEFSDATKLVQHLRMIKSEAEISVHAEICTIACNAFDQAHELFDVDQPINEAFRAFKIELLKQGAEDVPYLVGGAGQFGYGDVISPPDATPLKKGDVLMLDTGSTLMGAFCDFDRNFAFGHANDAVKQTHRTLWNATEAGLAAARPGAKASEIFQAMQTIIGEEAGNVGRYGHGLGMQLTEQPSMIDWDHTIIEEGMVMTLEPSMTVPGGGQKAGMLVHEENIVIRDGAPQLLTCRESQELRIL